MKKNKNNKKNNKRNIQEEIYDMLKDEKFQKGWNKYMRAIHHIPDPNKNGGD